MDMAFQVVSIKSLNMLKLSLLLRIASSNAPPLTKAAAGDVETIVGVPTATGDLPTLAVRPSRK